MLYPKNQMPCLSDELFRHPTSEYRAAPFWAWNCKLEKDELLRQLDATLDHNETPKIKKFFDNLKDFFE